MAPSPESLLVWGGILAAVGAALAAAFHVRGQGVDHYLRAQRLAVTSAALFATALLVLLVYFVGLHVSVEYVHRHTDPSAPLAYRVAGLWGGHEGTLLLWTTFAAAFVAFNARSWQRRVDRGHAAPPDASHPLPWTLLVGSATVAALGLIAALEGPFDRTPGWILDRDPDGRGLQPVLETPFMVLHPPIQFAAYGVAVLLFAAAVAHLATGRREWADLALPWARLGLLLAWTGLGIGALWAYYVLNFGGYWAWDPVETANLLVFLPLVPLVHGLIYYRKNGTFAAVAPLFGVLAFLSTLFATLATRTGLWVSVHSFTDPAETFDPDPLSRLLSILEADVLLERLASLFLVALCVAVLAYLWRARRALAPSRGAAPLAFGAGAFVLGAAGALAAVDAGAALGLIFEAGRRLWPANAAVGLGLFLLVLVVLLSLPALWSKEASSARPTRGLDGWLTMGNFVYAGMLVVALAYLVVFLVNVTTVNGYQRSHYDDRAPLIAAPLLVVLGVALSDRFVGHRWSLGLGAGSLATGTALAVADPDHWHLLLAAPALLFALFATCLKLFKVSDGGPTMPSRLRWTGLALLLGGLAALAYWANPPTRIPVLVAELHPGPWWAAVAYPLGLVALVGGVSTLRQRNWRLAVAGAAALAATLAWVVGLFVGLAALAVLARRRRDFREGLDAWDLRSTGRALRREIRKTGVYLIHVALVLGMAGYGASVYLATGEEALTLDGGDVGRAHGYEFRLVGSDTRGVDPRHQVAEEVRAHVLVTRGGAVVARVPLTMWLELPLHYAERVDVQRLALEDIYLRPVAFTLATPGATRTFEAHQDGVVVAPGAVVESVTFTAKVLPGMHLVWAGVWMIPTGVLVAMVFGAGRTQPTPAAGKD